MHKAKELSGSTSHSNMHHGQTQIYIQGCAAETLWHIPCMDIVHLSLLHAAVMCPVSAP